MPNASARVESRQDAGAPLRAPGSAGVSPARNWHSRGYLPHLDHPGLLQSITFRLADALPAPIIDRLKQDEPDGALLRDRLEAYLNAGHGACLLLEPAPAAIVEDTLLHFDGQRYRLLAWAVMPNHVHVLVETHAGHPLPEVIQSWKSFSAKAINHALGRQGVLWQREYFDRYIRDEIHLRAVTDYIENNPVQAGLVKTAGEWRFGSAWEGRVLAGSHESRQDAGAPLQASHPIMPNATARVESRQDAGAPSSALGSAGVPPAPHKGQCP